MAKRVLLQHISIYLSNNFFIYPSLIYKDISIYFSIPPSIYLSIRLKMAQRILLKQPDGSTVGAGPQTYCNNPNVRNSLIRPFEADLRTRRGSCGWNAMQMVCIC